MDPQVKENDLPTRELMRSTEQSGAFDFWKDEGEQIYTDQDGEPVAESHRQR